MKNQIEVDPEKIKDIPFFFILGRPRSGTTLIRTLFDAHPNVCIPLETIVIPELYPEFGHTKKWNPKKIKLFFTKAKKLRYYSNWKSDSEKLLNDLNKFESNVSYQDLIRAFYLNYISFYEKDQIGLIGDKTPFNSNHLPLLIRLFPEAKFIHVIRDPHEHILSMRKVDFGSNDAMVLSQNWKLLNKKIEKFKSKYPERFLTVKFEDFLESPEHFYKIWCDFLSIKFHEKALKFYEIKDKAIEYYTSDELNKVHSSLLKPIVPGKKDGWIDKMKKNDVLICEFVTQKYLKKYGYTRLIADFPLSWKIKILPKYLYIVHLVSLYNQLKNKAANLFKNAWHKFLNG